MIEQLTRQQTSRAQSSPAASILEAIYFATGDLGSVRRTEAFILRSGRLVARPQVRLVLCGEGGANGRCRFALDSARGHRAGYAHHTSYKSGCFTHFDLGGCGRRAGGFQPAAHSHLRHPEARSDRPLAEPRGCELVRFQHQRLARLSRHRIGTLGCQALPALRLRSILLEGLPDDRR